jgi:hypothetical protein
MKTYRLERNWQNGSLNRRNNKMKAIASNLFNLGTSFAGFIAHEDLRAADFLSEQIAAGVSVCRMSTFNALMVPGNNHARGQSAYTMVHPGISHYLDYPDVASIACPTPMMFCCGGRDDLFPVESIKEAFARMRKVWDSQHAGDNLVTKLYDSPQEYNLMMQSDAFRWLDKMLK